MLSAAVFIAVVLAGGIVVLPKIRWKTLDTKCKEGVQ